MILNGIRLGSSFLGILSILLLIGYLPWYLLLIRLSQLVRLFKSFISSINLYQPYYLLKDGLRDSGIIVDPCFPSCFSVSWFFYLFVCFVFWLATYLAICDWTVGGLVCPCWVLQCLHSHKCFWALFRDTVNLLMNHLIPWLLLWDCVTGLRWCSLQG